MSLKAKTDFFYIVGQVGGGSGRSGGNGCLGIVYLYLFNPEGRKEYILWQGDLSILSGAEYRGLLLAYFLQVKTWYWWFVCQVVCRVQICNNIWFAWSRVVQYWFKWSSILTEWVVEYLCIKVKLGQVLQCTGLRSESSTAHTWRQGGARQCHQHEEYEHHHQHRHQYQHQHQQYRYQ